MKNTWTLGCGFTLAMALILSGCAGQRAFREGKEAIAEGKMAQGLNSLQQAMKEAPSSHEYRNTYFRQREIQVGQQLVQADTMRQQGQLDQARTGYEGVLVIDPANQRAKDGLAAIELEFEHRIRLESADEKFSKGKFDDAGLIVEGILAENPVQRGARLLERRIAEKQAARSTSPPLLRSALQKSVSIEFRDASIRNVFELLSKTAGINFVLDKEVKPDLKVTLFIKNSSVEDVIRVVLVTNQLEQKVLNDNTLLIYPNTQAKTKDYQELAVRSFFLSNADVKQVANTIKTVVKTKDMVIDEKLNYFVMRDTPDAIRIAEQLVANQDIADPEVMLELEVLEVSTNKLLELGIRYPEQVSYSMVGADKTPGTVTLNEWKNRSTGLFRLTATNPLLIFNLRKTDSDTNLLANPRIRVKNRDKARIHIGERVPVITTTSTANVGVSESVNYLDVGLKLEVEPIISLDDEVTMKIGLEVSNILETVTRASGLQTYRLGTRNASTALRLRDGETQILAGLIQDDDRKTVDKVPGLGDFPVLGYLFSNRTDTRIKTEVVLLITPRIVRNILRPAAGDSEFLSGTEAVIGAAPVRLRQVVEKSEKIPTPAPALPQPSVAGPVDATPPATPQVPDQKASEPAIAPPAPTSTPAGKPASLPLPSAFQTPAASTARPDKK